MAELKFKSIIKDSWSRVWSRKLLWIFGALAGTGMFFYNFGDSWSSGQELADWHAIIANLKNSFSALPQASIFVSVWLIFFTTVLISFVCRAALIRGISDAEREANLNFGALIRFGWKKLGRIVGIEFILNIINIGAFAAFIVLLFFGGANYVKWLITLLAVIGLYNLFLFLFRFYIYCFAILDDQKFVWSIKAGWKLFAGNLKPLLMTKLVEVGLRLVSVIAILIFLLLCALPFVILAALLGVVFGETAVMVVFIVGMAVWFVALLAAQGICNSFFYHYLCAVFARIKE
ncbi:hypothetical protein HZB94_02265 [Candidatus Falkowbacteria bacterium]|nr:hypothetical protein [Candidatus Falkowbacteria bacterium]